jgi:tetratricopeptide (TPR) repeat protein
VFVKKVILIFILISSSVYAKTLKIETEPKEAEVKVEIGGGKTITLGKTPYEGDLEKLQAEHSGQKFLQIIVSKKGFNQESIMLLGATKEDITLNLKLKIDDYADMIVRYDSMISELFKAQKLIRSNNFSEALTVLDTLSVEYKDFSIIYELKGIALYMNKEIEKSLTMFRHAYSLNPKNIDSF